MKVYPDNSRELVDSADVYNYIHGGRGAVKLEAPSGKNHSYVFSKPRNRDDFPDDVIFVYALHNEKQLFYVGMIEQDKFRLTRYSRFLSDTEIVKGAAYINRWANTKGFVTPMKLYHLGVCCRCGRELSSEKSMKTGIGPRCKKMMELC